MVVKSRLAKGDFERLRALDTCTAANTIERLQSRLRHEGQLSGLAVRCMFPQLPPVLGYAVTGVMRSAMLPAAGQSYHENMGWWRFVASIPEPRILVVSDPDNEGGALLGELHALIAQALGCVAYVTNGAVRDLPAVERQGFQLFAGSVAVSHKYAHIAEYGNPVEIDGLTISPGDLLHGDRHGVHTIPLAIASQIPDMAAQVEREEEELRKLCRSRDFTLEKLEEMLRHVPGGGFELPLDGR